MTVLPPPQARQAANTGKRGPMTDQQHTANATNHPGPNPAVDISAAWSMLSQLGYPFRYSGKGQDGTYEYVIIDPATGGYLAKGNGPTLASSMYEAAACIMQSNEAVAE